MKNSPCLKDVFSKILMSYLFIPIMIMAVVITMICGFLGWNNLENHQRQVVESMAHIANYHIEHGERILDAVARVAEVSKSPDLAIFMESTLKAYGYFETIYYLNKDYKIELMTPSNSLYIGLDMSNQQHLNGIDEQDNITISRPFISLRTGTPTVSLVRALSNGGYIVGELNLALFQNEIMNINENSEENYTFIMDQTGTLIAHPSIELVKQQTNMSHLKIFHKVLGANNFIYTYDGKKVIGSAEQVKDTGWVVVNQVLVSSFFSSYAWILGMMLLTFSIIWLTLMVAIRKKLNRYVIKPLEQLTLRTNELIIGNYNKINSLPSISGAFVEINKLLVDFNYMSNSLQLRENALRESETRYRGLVDRLPIGLFRARLSGEILSINPMFMTILGYKDSEHVLNTDIMKFFHTLSIDNEQEQFMTENVHRLNNFEAHIHRNDGKIIWVLINTYIFYDIKEKAEFFEGSIQDITERKETQDKFNKQQEILFIAEKNQCEALEKALAMKDEFISLISHEFKTPLNVIYSAIQLIESVYFSKIPLRVQELVGNIKQNTFRQIRLTNNLLDITKINSGEIKLNIKNIDIIFLGKVITKSVEVYALQKNIMISFKSNIISKIISTDDEKVERIMLNILSNAIKFTDRGGKITVIIDEEFKENLIRIKIKDTGIGIPKDKQELIFERFGQVDNNLSRQAEGTGIGLSLVRLLVSSLGGAIEVQSELGRGSTFIIILPVKLDKVKENYEQPSDIEDRVVSEIKVQFSDIYF